MPNTCADPEFVANNPIARASDLMAAFADTSIAGIVSTIGGDDSIRLLPHLDLELITANPKVFVGYSDTTVTHLACFKAGLGTFYGPSVMSGFAENGGMHEYLVGSFHRAVFATESIGLLPQNESGWTVEMLDWAVPENNKIKRRLSAHEPWRFSPSNTSVRGHLLGGCLEVLEKLRGSSVWPTPQQWRNTVLFLETSESGSPPEVVADALRKYAAEGVLSQLSGILFGRPGGQIDPALFAAYDDAIYQVVRTEQHLSELPIVTGMDFGHTDPMMTLPYGAEVEIDCGQRKLRILGAAVID